MEDFCFYDNKLCLSRINLETNQLERFINEKEYPNIFLKINKLNEYDKRWLENDNNKCLN